MTLVDLNISERAFEAKLKRLHCNRGILIRTVGKKKEYILFERSKNVTLIRNIPSILWFEKNILNKKN